ncbi:MAG: alpha/beta hydrolase [Rubrivivax sp.]|nr:MAG: alpha/beta hydrolase [Rubrivivax sp.]
MSSPLHTLQLPQGPIDYLDQGTGQPLVFVHGLMAGHEVWSPLIPKLGPGLRCIVPTWPLGAHARPMAADADLSAPGVAQLIADFIEALDLREVILIGNDSGGALVQMVCARFPQRIARMVLTTCDAYDIFPPPAFAYLRWMAHVPLLVWEAAQLMHYVPPLRRLPFTFGDVVEGTLPGHLVERWLQPLRSNAGVRRDLCKFMRSLSPRHTQAAAEALKGFDRPVLLLWSTDCHHFPQRLAERMVQEWPDARVEWVQSRGVFLSLDHPAPLAAAMRRFVVQPVQALQELRAAS